VAENAALRARVKALETRLSESAGDPDWQRKVEAMLASDRTSNQLAGTEYAYGGEFGRILSFVMLDPVGEPRTWFTTGEEAEVRVEVEAHSRLPEPIFALTIKNRKGQDVYGTNTLYSRQPAPPLEPGDRRTVRFRFPLNLMPDEYFLSLGFTQFVGDELVVAHRRYDVATFSIHGNDRCFGIANCFATITVEPSAPPV
jgi:hypothetical protein